jgi:hypothetical protein
MGVYYQSIPACKAPVVPATSSPAVIRPLPAGPVSPSPTRTLSLPFVGAGRPFIFPFRPLTSPRAEGLHVPTRTLVLPSPIGARPSLWVPRVLQSRPAEARQVRTGTLPMFTPLPTPHFGWAAKVLGDGSLPPRSIIPGGVLQTPPPAGVSPPAGPSVVQIGTANATGTSVQMVWTNTMPAGNCRVVAVLCDQPNITVSSFSFYTQIGSHSVIPKHTITLWILTGGGSFTDTFLFSAPSGAVACGIEITGLLSNTLDQITVSNSVGPTVTGGTTGTLATAIEALVFVIGTLPISAPLPACNSPYSTVTTDFFSTTCSMAMGFAVSSSTSPVTGSGTCQAAVNYGSLIGTFQ